MKLPLATVILEVVGIIVVCVGIGIELAFKAEIGAITITVGSVLLAGGGMVYAKFYKRWW